MKCLVDLDPFAQPGHWRLVTRTGTTYEIHNDEKGGDTLIRREPKNDNCLSADLRRDRDWLRLSAVACGTSGHIWVETGVLRVGLDAILELEPLSDDASVTVRWTTTVAAILELP